jgi:hypothetical protein
MIKEKIIKIKPFTIKLEKICDFKFIYFEDAQNLSQAIELGGYFAKISKLEGTYKVDIYKDVHYE